MDGLWKMDKDMCLVMCKRGCRSYSTEYGSGQTLMVKKRFIPYIELEPYMASRYLAPLQLVEWSS